MSENGGRSQYWHASRENYGNERDFRDSLGYPILAPDFQTNQSGTCLREGVLFSFFQLLEVLKARIGEDGNPFALSIWG